MARWARRGRERPRRPGTPSKSHANDRNTNHPLIDRDKWTDAEYSILEETAERKGWEWVERLAYHVVAQAELFYGDL